MTTKMEREIFLVGSSNSEDMRYNPQSCWKHEHLLVHQHGERVSVKLEKVRATLPETEDT